MATMNISLPQQMKDWVEKEVATGRFANASDYMRDLVRREQEKLTALQKAVDDALASGISSRSPEELRAWVKERAEAAGLQNELSPHKRRRA